MKRRRMSKRLRKERNRSGKAECPICHNREILVEHHIHGRDVPNPEHPSNKVSICSNCHMKIHSSQIIIEGWIGTTAGTQLFWHKEGEESFTGLEAKPFVIEPRQKP